LDGILVAQLFQLKTMILQNNQLVLLKQVPGLFIALKAAICPGHDNSGVSGSYIPLHLVMVSVIWYPMNGMATS
jgi:hypothetical protein